MNTDKLKSLIVGGLAISLPGLLVAQGELSREQLEELDRKAREQASKEEAAKQATPPDPAPRQPTSREPVIPLAEPPQDLIDEDGNVELDLVDPFQRGTSRKSQERESEGLSSTSLGEISDEFRILAIMIPADETREPIALIRMEADASPQMVVKDDLIQIKRRSPDRSASNRTRSGAGDQPSFAESALNALEDYSFYLHIKEIHPTYIEAYQKKSPNESIILRW